jgi:creatinine amidohydrolase
MSTHRLEELSSPALDALDRDRTVVILSVSPLEEHGPHLPLGVDAFTARQLAEAIAERLTATRPGWTAVLAPTLHLGCFTFEAPGTISTRQRVVRDVLVDYGGSLARAGFRAILVASGHAGPGHLVALEDAAAIVSRRHAIIMASLTGHLAWEFLRGRYTDKVEAALGRPLSAEERVAFAEDAHGGLWETSVMLALRPELVDQGFRTLPAARYPLMARLRPNYPLRDGGQGYVGHPALADPAFAKAIQEVLLNEAMATVNAILDDRLRPGPRRSPFSAIPVLRTNFWPVAAATAGVLGVTAWWASRRRRS